MIVPDTMRLPNNSARETGAARKLVTAGKKPMQAVVAVMRKLLHAIWGMLKNDEDFDGNKFFKIVVKTA